MGAAWLFVCLILALAAAPAPAQMDPRWRTATDVTDLYRQRTGPADVLFVLDFSPAASAVMWHPYYCTGADYWTNFTRPVRTRDYPRDDPDRDCVYFRYTLARAAPDRHALTVRACWSDGERDFSGAYPFYGMEGPLVDRDGAVIDQAYLLARQATLGGPAGGAGSIGDPATWIQYATHVRLHTDGRSRFPSSAYCGADVAVPAGGRTVDLPVPWRLLESPPQVLRERYDDPDRGGYPGFSGFVYANHSRTTCPDGSGRMDLDTSGWDGHRPGGVPRPEAGPRLTAGPGPAEAGGVLAVPGGRPILYHTDYLFWIFFGTAGTPTRKNAAVRPTAMVPLPAHVIPQVTEANAKGRTATAWDNGLPARCRFQALKAALIATWCGTLPGGGRVRDTSRWSFRYLDPAGEEAGLAIRPQADAGQDRERSLRRFDHPGDLAGLQGKTPGHDPGQGAAATWAVANALVQGGAARDPGCGASLLVLVAAGGSWGAGPVPARYGDGPGPGTPQAGNARIRARAGELEPPAGRFWNPETLLGIAAHGGDGPAALAPGPGRAGRFLPFQAAVRDPRSARRHRPVTAFTVGIGLGGGPGDGLPGRLNAAALWGDPQVPPAAPFGDPRQVKASHFAHAQNEADLVRALARVAELASPAGADARWAAAGSLAHLVAGNTAYLGVFRPDGRSPRWGGDLIAAGRLPNGALADRDGKALRAFTPDGAVWAASRILAGYGTADRRQGRVYTLLPGAAGLVPVTPGNPALLADLTRAMPLAARPNPATLARCLWSMLGGDTALAEARGPGTGSYPMRADAMGDIIDSTPAMLAYPQGWADRYPALREQMAAARAAGARPRFRVLFAGTNQGHLHAFGEVSYDVPVAVDGKTVALPRGAAVELWSFIPTEAILQPWYLDDLDPRGEPNERPNPHPRLVDGAPAVYFNPRGRPGPALCRDGDTALLVFGLGKGGRSTYCLDVADPSRPELKWALRPDEVTPAGNASVRSMGLATSRPAIARALNAQGRVADFLVLGGGFSTPDMEDQGNWTDQDPPRPFGRSLLLFDVNRGPGGYRTGPGDILAHGDGAMASVSAGAVPLEWFRGGGLAQRIYCADRAGAIWVLAQAGPGDSSRVGDWVLRPVFRPRAGTVMSTLPEVFTLPQGRIPGTLTPAVGIVAGTGDRNHPMDEPAAPGKGGGGSPGRLFLVYDPHDPARYPAGLDEGHLAELTRSTEADPGKVLQVAAGTLRPALLGFSLELPARARVLHDPLVTHGALLLSLFTPREDPRDPCARAGLTETWRFAGPWSAWFGRGARGAGERHPPWAAASGRQAEAGIPGLAGDLALLDGGQVGQIGAAPEADGEAPAPVARAYRGRDPSRGLRIRAWRVVR